MTDRDAVLAMLAEHDHFVMIHRGVVRALGLRNGAVLEWVRWKARGEWTHITRKALGDEIGLSEDQVKRALVELIAAGLIEWEEPETMSRKRRYRIAVGADSADSTGRNRTLDRAESPDRGQRSDLGLRDEPAGHAERAESPDLPIDERHNRLETTIAGTAVPARSDALVPSSSVKVNQAIRDALYEAVIGACGWNYEEMTKRQRSSTGVAVSELVTAGATPAEVMRRAAIYRGMYRGAALTPNALASQWAALRGNGVDASKQHPVDVALADFMAEGRALEAERERNVIEVGEAQ